MKELFSIRNRESTWRIILISLIVGCFGFSGFVFYYTNKSLNESKKNIYVLVNDKKLVKAQATDITNSYNILTRGAVDNFNRLIFEHVPDASQINAQLNEARNISDKKTANLIDVYVQNNFYRSLLSQNYFTILTSDSIDINYSLTPHVFTYKGQLKVTRGKTSSLREIVTTGNIQYFGRSSKSNERGYYLSNFTLVSDNKIN